MKYFRTFIIGIVLMMVFICIPHTYAQDIGFEAEVSQNEVVLGSQLKLTLRIKGTQRINPIQFDDLDGFDVHYLGPQTNVQIINGQYASSVAYNYALVPQRIGDLKIPSFEIDINGQALQTDPIAIKVVDSIDSLSPETNDPLAQIKKKIFVRLDIPKDEVFIHEKVPFQILFYIQDVPVRNPQLPQLEQLGFKIDEFEVSDYQQYIDGKPYTIYAFKSHLYPTRSGFITIGPAELAANVLIRSQSRRSQGINSLFQDDFFSPFFGGNIEKRAVVLKSDTKQLNVKALPEAGQPDSFKGAVGQFTFDVSVSPMDVRVGDPITLRMELLGEGDVTAAPFPVMPNDDDLFKTYEPEIKKDYKSKTLEQVVIPTTDKATEIPQFDFTYYDVKLGKYITLTKGPFPIQVKAWEGDVPQVVGVRDVESSPEESEIVGEDIVFIKNKPGIWKSSQGWLYQQVIFWICLIVFFVAWLGLYFYLYRRLRFKTDSSFARRTFAIKKAKQSLSLAQRAAESNNTQDFFDQIELTLRNYLSDKLHLPAGAVTIERVKEQTHDKMSEADYQTLNNIWSECEAVRYGAGSIQKEAMMTLHRNVEELIVQLEKRL